jgi:uncharacterized membrane protein YphA (DoxX/SURF4 family)
MNSRLQHFAMPALRWTLGLVILWESYRFAVSEFAVHFLAKIGLPHWAAPVLGGSEIVAAILFLIPEATVTGGYLLLFIFAVAALFHFLHGAFDVSGLLVYAMAVIVCITQRPVERTEVSHD